MPQIVSQKKLQREKKEVKTDRKKDQPIKKSGPRNLIYRAIQADFKVGGLPGKGNRGHQFPVPFLLAPCFE